MKLLDQIQSIIDKYELNSISIPEGYRNLYEYLRDHPECKNEYKSEKTDSFLFDKYRKNIPKGWYGFSIGNPIISSWIDIIDEILKLCILNDPNFEINQIKIKFGGIRFYVNSKIIEDIDDIEYLVENTLYDKSLIY